MNSKVGAPASEAPSSTQSASLPPLRRLLCASIASIVLRESICPIEHMGTWEGL